MKNTPDVTEITKGTKVRAAVRITEEGFKRAGRTHVHARQGERGQVVNEIGCAPGFVTVRFERSGTACDVHVEELVA